MQSHQPGDFPRSVAFWTFCACFQPAVRLFTNPLQSLADTSASSILPLCLPATFDKKIAPESWPKVLSLPNPQDSAIQMLASVLPSRTSTCQEMSPFFLCKSIFFPLKMELSLIEAQPESPVQCLLAPCPTTAHVHSLPEGKCD